MSIVRPSVEDVALPDELRDLLNSPDGSAFEQALDVIVRQREQRLFRALGQLARDLHNAVRRMGGEMASDGMPDMVANARQHLQDALEMSAQAAHRSIDFADRLRPQAESLATSASAVLQRNEGNGEVVQLAQQAGDFAAHCREGLNDMVMAQSWQDLTGQRIKKVASFIGTVESSLLELVRLTGALAGSDTPESPVKVLCQDDADRLLSEFGF